MTLTSEFASTFKLGFKFKVTRYLETWLFRNRNLIVVSAQYGIVG